MTTWQIIEEALARRRPPRKPQWLAEQIGVSAQVMTNWKARKVPAGRFREIAEALGLSVDQLEGLAPLPWESAQTWPFPKIPLERLTKLDAADQGYCQRVLLDAIEKCERDQNTEAAFLDVMQGELKEYFPKPKFRKTSKG